MRSTLLCAVRLQCTEYVNIRLHYVSFRGMCIPEKLKSVHRRIELLETLEQSLCHFVQ